MASFRRFFGVDKFRWFIFRTTNRCNLHCEHCVVTSPRRELWDMPIGDFELFCERFEGVGQGEEDYHRLSGGEFTTLPVSQIKEIIDIFRNHKRKISVMTNGYNLLGIPDNYIQKIAWITLDNHGINSEHIEKCRRHLKGFYRGIIEVKETLWHYRLKKKASIRRRKTCTEMMRAPILFDGVVYPCCVLVYLVDSDVEVNGSLWIEGWCLENSDLREVMGNWRKSIPPYIYRQCRRNCYAPLKGGEKIKITLKSNDVVARRLYGRC